MSLEPQETAGDVWRQVQLLHFQSARGIREEAPGIPKVNTSKVYILVLPVLLKGGLVTDSFW